MRFTEGGEVAKSAPSEEKNGNGSLRVYLATGILKYVISIFNPRLQLTSLRCSVRGLFHQLPKLYDAYARKVP